MKCFECGEEMDLADRVLAYHSPVIGHVYSVNYRCECGILFVVNT